MLKQIFFTLFFTSSLIWGADLYLNTSADPFKGTLNVTINGETTTIELYNIEDSITKYPNGSIKSLSFQDSTHIYDVVFYPREQGTEQPALIKSFVLLKGKKILDGEVVSYSEKGTLLTKSSWVSGLLEGKTEIYSSTTSQILEDKNYAQGLPIGTWTFYYPEGTPFYTISFPNSFEEWKMSKTTTQKNGNSIATEPYPNVISIKKSFFDKNNNLSKEICFFAYLKNNEVLFLDKQETKSYSDGLLIQVSKEEEGNKKEKIVHVSIDKISLEEKEWLNSLFFKESEATLYHPTNQVIENFLNIEK